MQRVQTERIATWSRLGSRHAWALCMLLGWGLLTVRSHAAPGDEGMATRLGVPQELRPWIPWVLEGEADRTCPLEPPGRRCVWPSRLELELRQDRGQFRLQLTSHRKGFVTLPGSAAQWPQRVRVNGKPVVVLERAGLPAAWFAPGRHRVTGEWSWTQIPEYLSIPPATALVSARRGGELQPGVERVGPGRLRLGGVSERDSSEEESVALLVFRKILDGVPMRVRTRVELRVSGPPREVRLPSPLLPGSAAEAVLSKLTARWSEGGDLIVGALPGAHSLEIVALRWDPNSGLSLAPAPAPWPKQETWVFQAAPEVREVTLSGAPSVDPSRTALPPAWRELPAYRLTAGEELRFEPLRRGQPEPAQNLLSLRRRLWLDLDGLGFTAEDTLTGELRREFRLDLHAAPLLRAKLSGEPQLVTLHPETGVTGVELRQAEVDLQGVFRLPRSGPLPAVGWSEGVQALSADLALPPGFRLLAAVGVDEADSSWLSQWRLWDCFFVLVLSIGLLRLAHWRLAAALLSTLVLIHGRPSAPHWVWVLLLVALLLGRLPAQRLRWVGPWLRVLAVLCFSLVALRFCLVEARAALFPQLDPPEEAGQGGAFIARSEPPRAPSRPQMAEPPGPSSLLLKGKSGEKESAEADLEEAVAASGKAPSGLRAPPPRASRTRPSRPGLTSPAQDAVVQTGPAVPTWRFAHSELRWSGPVKRDQTFRLYLAPPWLTRTWAGLRALGCVLVGAWLVRRLLAPRCPPPGAAPSLRVPTSSRRSGKMGSEPASRPDTQPGGAGPPAGGAFCQALPKALSVGLVLGFGVLGSSEAAAAPSPELLRELKTRLLRPAPCAPHCVAVPRAELRLAGDELELELELEVGAPTSASLPGPASAWAPERVVVDRKPASLALGSKGHVRVWVDAGFHRLRARGRLQGDEVVVTFPQSPGRLTLALAGWQSDGLDAEGRVAGSLRLSRTTKPLPSSGQGLVPTEPEESASSELPRQWLLHRQIELGQEWVVSNRLERTEAQSGPRAPAAVVTVPLLEGETVSDPAVASTQGRVTLRLARGQKSKAWTSRLAVREALSLQAPSATARITERWRVRCGIVWRCEHAGPPPVRRFVTTELGGQGWLPEFWPWPGETLRLRLRRPEPAPGRSVTIERATLSVEAGARSARSTLQLSVDNTSAAREAIGLPEGASVERLRIDGRERPFAPGSTEAVVLLDPGHHQVSLTFHEDRGWGPLFTVPEVTLTDRAHNVRVEVSVPRDRWLLWARGPRWGPAIVFWPLLALTLLFAALLARVPQSPLRLHQWALLGLGLVSRPPLLGVAIVAWLLAVPLRAARSVDSRWGYNLLQVALALGTVFATGLIVAAVYSGLVVRPDMQVSGAGSHGFHLSWYLDQTAAGARAVLPTPIIWSLPLWVYRALMLVWALWLAQAWVRWLAQALRVFSSGPLWRTKGPSRS